MKYLQIPEEIMVKTTHGKRSYRVSIFETAKIELVRNASNFLSFMHSTNIPVMHKN